MNCKWALIVPFSTFNVNSNFALEDVFILFIFYFISFAYYMIQKNKGISITNAKLGRDTTTAVRRLLLL